MNLFEPRSMMQEHPHFDQASQRTKKEDTAGQASTYIFELP
jgi:hypothetical protein